MIIKTRRDYEADVQNRISQAMHEDYVERRLNRLDEDIVELQDNLRELKYAMEREKCKEVPVEFWKEKEDVR